MAEKLVIRVVGGSDIEAPLEQRAVRLGRDPGCDLHVDHPEVAPHAITLDYRNGSYLLENHSPFVVYLGQQAIEQNAQVAWPVGRQLQLTRSVSLTLMPGAAAASASAAAAAEEASEVAQAQRRRKILQIAVIAVCAVVAPILLLSERKNQPVPVGGFQELIEQLRREHPEATAVRDAFQKAHALDLRDDPQYLWATVDAYQQLLALEEIRSAEPDGDDAFGRIRRRAAQRVRVLTESGR